MWNKGLILIICLASILRLFWLDRIPTGVANDEIDYILNAKSVFLSGSDISHTWKPLSLTTPTSGFPQAEIAPLLTAWIIGPLPLSPVYSRIPYVLINIWLVVCIYLLTRKLIGPREAFVAGLISAINPWLIYFGRTAYDTPFAITALISGLYVLTLARGWQILWAFPLVAAGFYGYIGAKLLFLPFCAISVGYMWYVVNKRAFTLQYSILILLCLVCFGQFSWQQLHAETGKMNELSTPFQQEISRLTDYARKQSIQSPILPIIFNKFTEYIRLSAGKYTDAFSADFLFLHGDKKAQITVRDHGVLYILDAVFLLFGMGALYARKRNVFWLLGALILIAPIPSVLNIVDASYAIRSMLMAPILCIIIAVGIIEFTSRNPVRRGFIFVLYAISLGNFLYIYAYRNPVYNSESSSRSGRVLAKYLSMTDTPVYIVNGDPRESLKQYIFYTNGLTKRTSDEIANIFRTKKYVLNNLHFITCDQAGTIPNGSTFVFDDPQCKNLPSYMGSLIIGRLDDGVAIFIIARDHACGQFGLKKYPQNVRIADFSVEYMSSKKFCSTFITKY